MGDFGHGLFLCPCRSGCWVFPFGVSIARDRESSFERWHRSLPGCVAQQWAARLIAAPIFVTLSVALVIVMAPQQNGIHLDATAWAPLGSVRFASVVPATPMGLGYSAVLTPSGRLLRRSLRLCGGSPGARRGPIRARPQLPAGELPPVRMADDAGWAACRTRLPGRAGRRWCSGGRAPLAKRRPRGARAHARHSAARSSAP